MRDYIKPFIEDEEVEIEDICSVSPGDALQEFEDETDADDLFK